MNKATYRVATVIEKRTAAFAAKYGCTEAVALQYLKATNYCANYAGANYLRDQANIAAANAPQIGHFYTPIEGSKALKYQGIATTSNKQWFVEENPGTIILPSYIADRITASNYDPM